MHSLEFLYHEAYENGNPVYTDKTQCILWMLKLNILYVFAFTNLYLIPLLMFVNVVTLLPSQSWRRWSQTACHRRRAECPAQPRSREPVYIKHEEHTELMTPDYWHTLLHLVTEYSGNWSEIPWNYPQSWTVQKRRTRSSEDWGGSVLFLRNSSSSQCNETGSHLLSVKKTGHFGSLKSPEFVISLLIGH